MKRLVLIFMCFVLLIVLSGCAGGGQQQTQAKSHGVVANCKILTKEKLAEFDAKGLMDMEVPTDESGNALVEPVITDIPLFTNQPSKDVETPTPTFTPTPSPTPSITAKPAMHVFYKYEDVTDEVILATLPRDKNTYSAGASVPAKTLPSNRVTTDAGVWKFNGWTKTMAENGIDIVYVGSWTLVEPVATETPTEEPTPEPTETPEPTSEVTETPEVTEAPTEEPTPEPTEELTPEPTAEITVALVTAVPVSGNTPLPPLEIPTRVPDSALNPMTNTGYRFQNFVLQKAGLYNAVFSGEAILSGLSLWNALTTGAEHDVIDRYVGRDYLSYESSNTLIYARRLWLDTKLTKGSRFPRAMEKFTEQLNMKDPSATSTKNNWVNQITSNYFNYTPSVLDEKTYVDLTSQLYFRDVWKTGQKLYDTKEREFHNLDGSTTSTTMLRDEGLTYWRLSNAVAYCMYFYNGNYLMIVLPDDGVEFSDVDVRSLMTGKVASQKAHIRFFMPGFTTESSYTFHLSDFMLSSGIVDENVVFGLPSNFEPVFTQVDKVSFNQYGCGNVITDEVMKDVPSSYSDDLDVISIVCDRPFMYYIGDAANQDIALFGVLNILPETDAVHMEQ